MSERECPSCKRKVDDRGRCWWCFDRPCVRCGRWTGGCFFPHCIACEAVIGGEAAGVRALVPDAPGEPPAAPQVWVVVYQVEAGPIPTSVRVRQIVKHSWRRHGMKAAGLRLALPEGVRIEEVVTEDVE